MPELPEVETIVNRLSSKLRGLEVSSFNVLFAGILRCDEKCLERLEGKKIIRVRRRGKLVIFDFENGFSLLFHLKMTGQLILSHPDEPRDRHTHFIITFRNCSQELRFRNVRKFGFVCCLQSSEIEDFFELGAEPLSINFSLFKGLFEGRRARLKSLLTNQGFIAGIGNIYADEILFEAQLHPLLAASSLDEEELRKLWRSTRKVLRKAIQHRGSSIRDYRDADGEQGDFQSYHKVYGKESSLCPRCGGKIERLRLGGRSSYYCPSCQMRKGKN
ncbi:MAG: bifunctional DNA-formamidopyrimidine glycosylase/DNA-(apurinic or apyrimidinic site) lyase [Candidatus Aminicenantales bacterium]